MIDVDYNEYKETIAENIKLIEENHRLKERLSIYESDSDTVIMSKEKWEETKQEIERLNNIIFNQNKRNSHQRIANDNLQNKNKELNNIINELEKELFIKKEFYERGLTKRPKNDSEYNTQYADSCALAQISVIYDKLQKLKGSGKE